MQIIRCTQKLLKEMGLKSIDLCTFEPNFSYLGSWHANLLHIDSKKVLGSMNDLAFHYKRRILFDGGIFNALIPDIINKLNHMPMGSIGYKFVSEELKLFCESAL